MTIEITQQELQRARTNAISKLNGTTGIRKKIYASSKESGLESKIYEIVSDSLSIQTSLYEKLTTELSSVHASEFSLLFSSYVAAYNGLNQLAAINGGIDTKSKGIDYFERISINFQNYYPKPLDEMLLTLSDAFEYPLAENSFKTIETYFEWILRETISSKDNPRYSNLITKIQKEGVKVENKIFKNFQSMSLNYEDNNGKKLNWDYLGGYEKIKDYFKDFVTLIKGIDHCNECKDYMPLDERLIKGTLLAGPPNTGKTKMVEIFAGSADIPYDMFSVADVGSEYVYKTSKNLMSRFESAGRQVKQGNTPVYLIYMMEVDAMTRKRGENKGSVENDNAVTELNIHMRGPKAVPGVIVIGDTNNPESIDPAVVSAGRFTRILYMGYPDKLTVSEIFKKIMDRSQEYNSKKIFDPKINLQRLSNLCNNETFIRSTHENYNNLIKTSTSGGYTGGDIQEILNNSRREKLLSHLKYNSPISEITEEDIIKNVNQYDAQRGWKL